LIERYGFLGGMGTAAGVTNFCGLHANVHGEMHRVVQGIASELLARIDRLGGLNAPHLILGKILAQAYDTAAYKIAADNAVFSITEVRWGLTAAIIIPQLCDAIGVRQVRRYALTGERFDAQDARRIGLVHEVVPLAHLETAGAKVVEQLLANGPEALAETKALAMEISFGGMSVEDDAYARLVRVHAAKRQTAEASEGLASFAEKRAANWAAGKT